MVRKYTTKSWLSLNGFFKKKLHCHCHCLFNDNCKRQNNLSAMEINAPKALNRNKDIRIQKADKGNSIVISDKEKYIEGVKSAIPDANKFVQLIITSKKYCKYIINYIKLF